MNQFHLFGVSFSGQSTETERDIGSPKGKGAGDGFKGVFEKLIYPKTGSNEGASFPQASSSPKEYSRSESSLASQVSTFDDPDDTKDVKPEYSLEDEIELEDVIDELRTSHETLDSEEAELLVEKVKELLKDPKIAKEVLDVLEASGVDLGNLNELDLKEALSSLPHHAREELIEILQFEEEESTGLTLAEAISEALGELRDEFNKSEKSSSEEGIPTPLVEEGADESLDQFLSKAQVTSIDSEDEQALDQQQTDSQEQPRHEHPLEKFDGLESELTSDSDVDLPLVSNLDNSSKASGVSNVPLASALTSGNTPVAENANQLAGATSKVGGDTKAIRIPVSQEAPRSNLATEVEKSQMMKRILARALMHKNDQGEVKFSVRLEPSELGNVRVSFHQNSEGVLNALIAAENDAARQTLQANVGDLKMALNDQGVKVENIQVVVDSRSEAQNQARQEQERQRRREETIRRMVTADRRQDKSEDNQEAQEDVLPDETSTLSVTA